MPWRRERLFRTLRFGQDEIKVALVALQIGKSLLGGGFPDLPVFIALQVASPRSRVFLCVHEVNIAEQGAVSIASASGYECETERQLTDPSVLTEC